MTEETNVQVYVSDTTITNENRKDCEAIRIARYPYIEVWVNDKLVYSSSE